MSHSPVLFESDEEYEDFTTKETEAKTEIILPPPSFIKDEKCVRNLKQILSGVPPPPNYTTPEIDVSDLLTKWCEYTKTQSFRNIINFNLEEATSTNKQLSEPSNEEKKSCKKTGLAEAKEKLQINFCSIDEPKAVQHGSAVAVKNNKPLGWPEAAQVADHDIYYNLGSVSEELTSLLDKYRDRFIGSETGSSFVLRSPILTASAKKRARRRAWGGYSPGRRLSHLAQRRRTFSSANLSLYSSNLNGKAILPGSLNNNKSVVTKKIIMVDTKSKNNQRSSKSTSKFKEVNKMKRALFQSPDQICKSVGRKEKNIRTTPNKTKVSKRALWPSSEKKNKRSAKKISPKKIVIEESDDAPSSEEAINANGKRLSSSSDSCHVKKKCQKSLNFNADSSTTEENPMSISTQVENSQQQLYNQPLSKIHKQKMVWAVASSLKQSGINASHELFRPAGTVLFKKCCQVWMQMLSSKKSVMKRSTSEQMFEIAVKYASETVKKLKSSNLNSTGVPSLSGDNFVNITKITNEEKNRTPGFSKVSDIFFSNAKTSISCSQNDPNPEAVPSQAKLCSNSNCADSNSNSLSHASSDVSFSQIKSTETASGINSNHDLSNSNTDDSIEKNLRLMFEGVGSETLSSKSNFPKIFDEESQSPQFNTTSERLDINAKPNVSLFVSVSDACDKLSKKNVESNTNWNKSVVNGLKVGPNHSHQDNDSGFIENEGANCDPAKLKGKSCDSSQSDPVNKIDYQVTNETHSIQIAYEVQSPNNDPPSSSSKDSILKCDKNKENQPSISTKTIDSSFTSSRDPSTFRFKKFGSSCENVDYASKTFEKCNQTIGNPIDFDDTALSSCDISVNTT